MLGPLAPTLADDGPDGHRHFGASTGHQPPRRHPVDHLVHGIEHEIEPLVHDHGAQPGIGCARRQRGDPGFGDRGVEHALGAELVHEPCCGAEYPGGGIRANSTHEDIGI